MISEAQFQGLVAKLEAMQRRLDEMEAAAAIHEAGRVNHGTARVNEGSGVPCGKGWSAEPDANLPVGYFKPVADYHTKEAMIQGEVGSVDVSRRWTGTV